MDWQERLEVIRIIDGKTTIYRRYKPTLEECCLAPCLNCQKSHKTFSQSYEYVRCQKNDEITRYKRNIKEAKWQEQRRMYDRWVDVKDGV